MNAGKPEHNKGEARILGLIPARGGSKRVPGKNIRPLGGRPLLDWTITAAQDSESLCDLLLTTDDADIAEAGRRAGALVPWLRPAHLATDNAGSLDVTLHALDWYEATHGAVDGLMLLQPTSPFRSADTIRRAAADFIRQDFQALVSVCPAELHPEWCFRLDETKPDQTLLSPYLGWEPLDRRSQDLPPAYVLNGALYLIAPATLRRERSFIFPGVRGFIMNASRENIDIDTEEDWQAAECVACELANAVSIEES